MPRLTRPITDPARPPGDHRRRPAHGRARARGCGDGVAGGTASIEAGRSDISRRLRLAAERLGPTYIKLGQIISSGEGLFPPELVDEFKKCRDQVPAETFDDVRRTVEEDLGSRLEDVFESFDAHAARRGVDRPGPRGAAAHRRGRRRQGAAARRSTVSCATTCG